MRQYAALAVRADACTGCSAPCANACPDGIPIPQRTRETHALLSLGPGDARG
jgi:ferredoxin